MGPDNWTNTNLSTDLFFLIELSNGTG